MNDEKEKIPETDLKLRKYITIIGTCMIAFAVLLVAISDNVKTENRQTTLAMPTTQADQVKADAENEPDIRNEITIIVPATELQTTARQEITPLEEYTTKGAPASYSLPLSTAMGNDFSRGVPVYNEALADWRTHNGVDFLGAYGDGVKCIADGIVTEIRNDPVMGGVIVVDHGGGVVATYCGVEANETLSEDIFVAENDMLGTLGNIPCEASEEYHHLHLEIRVNGEIADPLEIMGYD